MSTKYTFRDIISYDEGMHGIIETAKKFALLDSNVLIEGETGTGKELFTQSIHQHSMRRNQPFVAINCASLPEHLLESELFGYTGGAFTGASKEGKKGLFELAHNGTLFLDEVSELPLPFQGKLLRALQEREIRRIGDDRIIPIDVRIIAATNKGLRSMAENGQFRRDLYFRLDILEITIPPLRGRPKDILPLFTMFLRIYAERFAKPLPTLTQECEARLVAHPWTGNVRELKNMAERVMALYEASDRNAAQIMARLFDLPLRQRPSVSARREEERNKIASALASAPSRDDAAKILNMSRTTLWRKMKTLELI
jgi:propionate catabolism operon transcriptional regulator